MPRQRLLFFDCESTGLPLRRGLSPWDVEGWPRLVQLAWGIYDLRGNLLDIRSHIIRPDGFVIPAEATAIHGITHSRAVEEGEDLARVLEEFGEAIESPSITLVAHNIDFDCGVVGAEFIRLKKTPRLLEVPAVCTMKTTPEVCRLPRPSGWGFKWPTLGELHLHLFGSSFEASHDAASDLQACARCFFQLVQDGYYRLDSLIKARPG
jgi:DNA polymerase III epsilon subunit-like protein